MTLILLRPWWLLALLPVAGLALWVWRRPAMGGWQAIIAAPLLARMRDMGFVAPGLRHGVGLLPFLVAAVVVVALSGPARWREAGGGFEQIDPLILMLDLSASVTQTTRLADAQAAAALVLQQAGGRPVGLMVYAADAYVASAPTADAASLQSLIAVLDQRTMPVGGSRPDIAIGAARDLFTQGGTRFAVPGPSDAAGPNDVAPGIAGADLILISDGGGVSPRAMQEAERLRNEGARLWALGLTGAGILTTGEGNPAPPADPDALMRLTAIGGGSYAPARTPRPLLDQIASARTERFTQSRYAALMFDDLGRWLLLLTLLPAVLLFRRGMAGGAG